MKRIAVLTFEGYNELDSFIAFAMLNRVRNPKFTASIVCPGERATSMNGLVVESQAPLSFASEADAVIVGSGINTREIVRTPELMARLELDPSRQVIGAQCSGTLVLAKLGLLAAWVIGRLAGWKAAEAVVHYVAPVGQKDEYVQRAHAAVGRFL